jgi:PAS domain S-box-containing protein
MNQSMSQEAVILCVSSDAQVLKPFRDAFTEAGFLVREAYSGSEALVMTDGSPDLFLIDLFLPDMSGFEVCCRLRAKPATSQTPVLHFASREVPREKDMVRESPNAYFSRDARPAEILKAAQAMLEAREADRTFEAFLESAPDATVIVNESGTIVRVNSQAERLFGYGREELIGKPLEILVPARFRNAHQNHRIRYFEDPHPRPMEVSSNLVGLRKDGTEFPIDVSLNALSSRGERFVASAIRDITRQRELEEELRRRWAQLAEADRRKDEALATVAHELRSPLTAIVCCARALSSPQENARDARKIGESIERQSTHMLNLVEELMDLARVRTGQAQLRLETCDVQAIIEKAVEISRPAIETGQHVLHLSVPQPAPCVRADSARLVQIIVNLLNNAAKFTPSGGNIWLSVMPEGSQIVFKVRDSGVGLPEEKLSAIFDPFSTAGSARQSGKDGLGLGLAIARQLAELHAGTIEATSNGQDCGSEFIVRLPGVP